MYRCPWDPQVVQPNKALHGTFLGPPHTVRPVGLGPGGPKKVPRINKVPRIANCSWFLLFWPYNGHTLIFPHVYRLHTAIKKKKKNE